MFFWTDAEVLRLFHFLICKIVFSVTYPKNLYKFNQKNLITWSTWLSFGREVVLMMEIYFSNCLENKEMIIISFYS